MHGINAVKHKLMHTTCSPRLQTIYGIVMSAQDPLSDLQSPWYSRQTQNAKLCANKSN